ncbi:MAG: nucleotide exchange factor GrpE [Muribaculaceae bacterium]
MSKKQKKENIEAQETINNTAQSAQEASANETEQTAQETAEGQQAPEQDESQAQTSAEDTIAALQAEIEKQKNEYLFLMAEFDNFRKRTLKEKAELIRNAGEKAFETLLPVVDDFERAIKANETSSDIDAVKEGFTLIYNKLIKYLNDNQVKAIESTGCDFNTELHEAVATFPANDPQAKGKVFDTITTGYTINDKVLRHAKVVVAQ